ncbi:MAG: hypothetical protein HA496_06470 [Thaumarchaeota archaeon]|jgi:predicted hydrocarbon binding protein|nr:hypothetical protein [Nitrososphaerota archaeon]
MDASIQTCFPNYCFSADYAWFANARGGSEESYGHFSRGRAAGFFTRLLDRDVKTVETMCIAKGDSWCEFTIGEL